VAAAGVPHSSDSEDPAGPAAGDPAGSGRASSCYSALKKRAGPAMSESRMRHNLKATWPVRVDRLNFKFPSQLNQHSRGGMRQCSGSTLECPSLRGPGETCPSPARPHHDGRTGPSSWKHVIVSKQDLSLQAPLLVDPAGPPETGWSTRQTPESEDHHDGHWVQMLDHLELDEEAFLGTPSRSRLQASAESSRRPTCPVGPKWLTLRHWSEGAAQFNTR
jgi:hypothetical protein